MNGTRLILLTVLLTIILPQRYSAKAQSLVDWLEDNLPCDDYYSPDASYSSLTEFLMADIVNEFRGDFIWQYNFPYDFPQQDDPIFFNQHDFSGGEWFEKALENEPGEHYVGDLQNYYFWLYENYLFVCKNSVSIMYNKGKDEKISYEGATDVFTPYYFNDFSILSLDENNKWTKVSRDDKCLIISLWLNARFYNDIDKSIKREIVARYYSQYESPFEIDSVELNSKTFIIAPMYQNVRSTLFDRLWTINPSYLNDLWYLESIQYGRTYMLRFNTELWAARFHPIRNYLESNKLTQCYLCIPKFALTGDTLTIRLEYKLCTLNTDGGITQELINTSESTYRYTPKEKRWIKQE